MRKRHSKWINRRKILKTTGTGLISAGALAGNGTATPKTSDDCETTPGEGIDEDCRGHGNGPQDRGRGNGQRSNQEDCKECLDREVLDENATHQVTRVETNEETYVFWIVKETGRVTELPFEEETSGDEFDLDEIVLPQNHDEVIERSELKAVNEGSCSSRFYQNHNSAVFALETGDSLDDYPSGVLGAAICAAIGAKAGGPAGSALAAIVCYSIDYFFLDHINLSGKDLSIGARDCHGGFFNQSSICVGVDGSYTTDESDLQQTDRISGPHLELGDSINRYL